MTQIPQWYKNLYTPEWEINETNQKKIAEVREYFRENDIELQVEDCIFTCSCGRRVKGRVLCKDCQEGKSPEHCHYCGGEGCEMCVAVLGL